VAKASGVTSKATKQRIEERRKGGKIWQQIKKAACGVSEGERNDSRNQRDETEKIASSVAGETKGI